MQLSYKFVKSKFLFSAFLSASMLLVGQSVFAQDRNIDFSNNNTGSMRLAQLPQEGRRNHRIRRFENNAVTGANGGGSMSGRFKKYMDRDSEGTMDGRGRFKQRFGDMSSEDKAALRQRVQSMSPQERRQFMMKMRQRRGGMSDGNPGPGRRGFKQGGGRNRHVRNHSTRRGKKGMRGGRSWFNRKPLDLGPLGLSEKQKSKITNFRQSNAIKARAVNKRLRAQRSRMKSMMFDPGASRDDIMLQKNQLRSLQNQAEDIMINDFLSIREVLTKEQLQMLPQIAPGRRRTAKRKGPPKVAPAIGQESKGSGI